MGENLCCYRVWSCALCGHERHLPLMYLVFAMAGYYTILWRVAQFKHSHAGRRYFTWSCFFGCLEGDLSVFDRFQAGKLVLSSLVGFFEPLVLDFYLNSKGNRSETGPFSNQTLEQAPAEGSKKGAIVSQGLTPCVKIWWLYEPQPICVAWDVCATGKI